MCFLLAKRTVNLFSGKVLEGIIAVSLGLLSLVLIGVYGIIVCKSSKYRQTSASGVAGGGVDDVIVTVRQIEDQPNNYARNNNEDCVENNRTRTEQHCMSAL